MISLRISLMGLLTISGACSGVAIKSSKLDNPDRLRPTAVQFIEKQKLMVAAYMVPGLHHHAGRIALYSVEAENHPLSLNGMRALQFLDYEQKKFTSLVVVTNKSDTWVVAGGADAKIGAEVSWYKLENKQLVPVKSLAVNDHIVESLTLKSDDQLSVIDVVAGESVLGKKTSCRITLMGDQIRACKKVRLAKNQHDVSDSLELEYGETNKKVFQTKVVGSDRRVWTAYTESKHPDLLVFSMNAHMNDY